MKKSTVVKELAKKNNLSIKEVESIIDNLFEIIVDSLKSKESVSFIRFGSFVLVKRKGREVYLPGSKERVKIDPKYGIKFRPSRKLQKILEKEIKD
jgi:nucleoid DNA-binding protein